MPTQSALLIFIKNPLKGTVKTRLAQSIGDEQALMVYQYLLQHTRNTVNHLSSEYHKLLFYSNFINTHDEWLATDYDKHLQSEGDLGNKMYEAFSVGFAKGYTHLVIIGSDCLALDTTILQEAFTALLQHDFVVGPAKDGGYYLLGMQSLEQSLFKNKQWSSATVLSDTLADIAALGKSYYLLPQLSDIDYVSDIPKSVLAALSIKH